MSGEVMIVSQQFPFEKMETCARKLKRGREAVI